MKSVKKKIVLCTSRIYDPQVHGFIEILNEHLKKENAVLMVFTINSDLYWEEDKDSAETTVFDIIPYEAADVIVIMDEKIKSHKVSEKIILNAEKYNKPVVVVDGYYKGLPNISFDYAAGFELLVKHVLEQKKFKKPHIMAGIPDNPFSDERINVFKKVIEEYGYTFDDSMVSYGYFWAMPARNATEKLLESDEIPDAIICANDIMAINVCDILQNHGYKIPEDVMIAGFDGYDEVFITSPKITTASCTTPELADAAYKLVKNCLSEGILDEEGSISVVPVLIVNESTGCESNSGYDRQMLSRFNNSFYRHQDDVRVMYEAITKMQICENTDEMFSLLDDIVINEEKILKDVQFVVNQKCFDIDNYYFKYDISNIDHEDFCMLYDPDISTTLVDLKNGFIRPDAGFFIKRAESGYPLIFNALDYMNVPLGYICYSFNEYSITKYSSSANITNTISMGIGSYINMTYQKCLADKVDRMYKKDSLTGLYNRIGFNNVYEGIKKSGDKKGMPITVIMSDLDGLKFINDNFGHAEGDNAILTAATALKKACPDKAICVRFGGDELFSVIIGECDTDRIIKKIERLLSDYNRSSMKEYSVVTSCGYNTSVFDDNFDIKKALRKADEEMYVVKKEHQNSSWYSVK